MPKTCYSVSLKILNTFIMLMAGSLWAAILLSSFLQGLSMQRPEEEAFLSIFNISMPRGEQRDWSLPVANILAIFDSVNQGLILVLSHFSRQITHLTHDEILAGQGYAVLYAALGLCIGATGAMSAYNGLNETIMDIGMAGGASNIEDLEKKALGFAITISVLSGSAAAYFAYSRGREIHGQEWYPTTVNNQRKFLLIAILRNLGQFSLNFYQAQRATRAPVSSLLLSFASLLGTNLTQIKSYGIDLRNTERHLNQAPSMSALFLGLYYYLKCANAFNILTAPAILRSNLNEIEAYRVHQDELSIWIPTVVVGIIFGASALVVNDSVRIMAIKNLFATSVLSDFMEQRVRPLLHSRGDALLCWKARVNEEAESLLPMRELVANEIHR